MGTLSTLGLGVNREALFVDQLHGPDERAKKIPEAVTVVHGIRCERLKPLPPVHNADWGDAEWQCVSPR